MLMETFTKASGWKIKPMATVFIPTLTAPCTNANRRRTSRTVIELSPGQMALLKTANTSKEKNAYCKFKWAYGSSYEGHFADNNINGKGVYIWEINAITWAIGKIIKWTDRECLPGRTKDSSKACTRMIRRIFRKI